MKDQFSNDPLFPVSGQGVPISTRHHERMDRGGHRCVRLLMIGLIGVWIVASTSCASLRPDRYVSAAVQGSSALLNEARLVTRTHGLPAARELVVDRLGEMDQSGGELEKRTQQTTRDPNLVLPDSLAALSKEERRRVAIVIIPGTRVNTNTPSKTRDVLRDAARAAQEMEFSTHFIDTPPRGGVSENAVFVAEQVEPIFDRVDHVVLVMLSKGAHDVIYYLQEYAMELPLEDRRKIDVVISLAGTVQGSVVADFFANGQRPLPVAARMTLNLRGRKDQIGMLETVAASPWSPDKASRLGEALPNLTWVSLVMVPDGEDGRISERLWSPFIRKRIFRTAPYYSPNDGLVESAASVLPDEVNCPEWIVCAYGSHSMSNGEYKDGSRVAPQTTTPSEEELNPESGGEVMSAYLRALPRSLLDY